MRLVGMANEREREAELASAELAVNVGHCPNGDAPAVDHQWLQLQQLVPISGRRLVRRRRTRIRV